MCVVHIMNEVCKVCGARKVFSAIELVKCEDVSVCSSHCTIGVVRIRSIGYEKC